jgi:hypothetical protein
MGLATLANPRAKTHKIRGAAWFLDQMSGKADAPGLRSLFARGA